MLVHLQLNYMDGNVPGLEWHGVPYPWGTRKIGISPGKMEMGTSGRNARERADHRKAEMNFRM